MSKSLIHSDDSGFAPGINVREILKSAPISVFTSTPEGRYISANSATARMFGYDSPQELMDSITDIGQQQYVNPSDRLEFMRLMEKHGEVVNHEFQLRRRDGTIIWVSRNAQAVRDQDGRIIAYQGFYTDISHRKRVEQSLKQIEWMLSKQPASTTEKADSQHQGYGDLTELNRSGIILKSIGHARLKSFADDYLELLGTSSAIYEANGDYAYGIFASGWCRMMDSAARKLCASSDNGEALNSGKWLCHESCWTDCSRWAITSNSPVDIECNGGIRLYAVPIVSNGEVVGAINFGYGDPPTDPEKLRELADRYRIGYDDLVREAAAYDTRPPYIIELAKNRLHATARLIGSMIETRRTETELRESEARFKALHNASFGGIAIHDQGIILECNQGLSQITGYFPEDLIGMNGLLLISEKTREMVLDKIRAGHEKPYEVIGVRKNKEEYPIRLEARNIPYKGKMVRVVEFRDITEQKRAEQALVLAKEQAEGQARTAELAKKQAQQAGEETRQALDALRVSEEKLYALFSSMTEVVVLHELMFNEQGEPVNYQINDCNEAFTRITGLSKHDVQGKLATEAYQSQTPPYLKEYSRVALTGEPHRFDTYFAPMDKYFTISAVCPSIGSFATIATDITEITRMQQMVSAKNKELEQLVYIASHDLRSPLVNVDGYGRELEFAVEDLAKALDRDHGSLAELQAAVRAQLQDMEDALHYIRTSTSQMDALLKGLLKLSRSGRTPLNIGPLNMNELMARVIAAIEFQIEKSGVDIIVGDLPPCRGDVVQVTQVFSNLLGNALKFLDSARPGVIRISGGVRDIRCEYCVEDNGIGIEPEHQKNIFELFHRLDPTRNEGEGLGLTIVRQVVERLDGSVRVESEPGQGSRFIVSLPIAPGI